MKLTPNRMTLIKLSTVGLTMGLGLLAVMIGIQVRSNEDPTQTSKAPSSESPLQVQPIAKVPQEQASDAAAAPSLSQPNLDTEALSDSSEQPVAPTKILSVEPLQTDATDIANAPDVTEPTAESAPSLDSEPQVSEPQVSEPQVSDTQVSEPTASGSKISEPEVLDTTAPESVKQKAPKAEAPETATAQASAPVSEPPEKAVIKTIIRPNQSVGPVTPTTTRADLVQQFGEAALEEIAVHIGEGFTEPGTRVNLGPDQSFSVIWNSETGQAMQVRDFGKAWKTAEGVGMGTSLKEIEAIAGPFELFGFGWDYGGTVMLNDSATMEHKGLTLRVHPKAEQIDLAQPNSPQTQAYLAVLGDSPFSSQHESFDLVDAFVYDIIVNFQDS